MNLRTRVTVVFATAAVAATAAFPALSGASPIDDKRRQAAVGIRITPRGFGKDWRYPITSAWAEWKSVGG